MTKIVKHERESFPYTVFPNGVGWGVFVREMGVYAISEEFRVMPISTSVILKLLQGQGVTGKCDVLEERVVSIEVFQLLCFFIVLQNTFDRFILAEQNLFLNAPFNMGYPIHLKEGVDAKVAEQDKMFELKLILRKSDRKVLYAEAGSDFVDLTFSFLTYPLGAIVKLLGGNTPMQGLNMLYDSVKAMSDHDHFESDECKDFLVHPKLPPCYKCDSQILKVDEEIYPKHYMHHCRSCLLGISPFVSTHATYDNCQHGKPDICLEMVNPKSLLGDTVSGGPFAKLQFSSSLMIWL